MRKIISTLFIASSSWAWVSSGVPLNTSGYDPAYAFGKSFFDLTKFQSQQSLTFGWSGSSFGSQSGGLYLNQMSYQLSPSLRFQFDVGMSQIFQSSMPQGMGASPQNLKPQLSIPHIGLEYKPTDNFKVGIHWFNFNSNSMYANPISPWGFSPWTGW